jgi:hypothetical protein
VTETQTPERNALGETPNRVLARRIVIVIILLACVGGLYLAANHTRRGDEPVDTTGNGLPSSTVVEQLQPQAGDTLVNQQAQVGIDLTTPYTASLVIDGVAIPDDQLLKRPELSAIYFTPGEGKVLTKLPPGQSCAQALVTRVDGTPENIPVVTWCFGVA